MGDDASVDMAKPLDPNATFLLDSYAVTDTGVDVSFVCANPGAGQVSMYIVHILDAELTSASDIGQLIQDKLQRKIRGLGLVEKLSGFVGSKYVV